MITPIMSTKTREAVTDCTISVEMRNESKNKRHHFLRIPNEITFFSYAISRVNLTLIIMLCLLHSVTCNSDPLKFRKFNLCGKFQTGHAISVPSNIHCVLPEPFSSDVKNFNVTLWVPRSQPVEIEAVKCYSLKRTVCTYYGPFWSKSIISDSTETTVVYMTDCKSAVRTKQFHTNYLSKISASLYSTNHSLSVRYVYCCYDFCQSVENFFIEFGYIATYDGKFISSNIGITGGCVASEGVCAFRNAIILWNSTKLSSVCNYKKAGIFSASRSGDYVTIEAVQGAFKLIGPTNNCNLTHAFQTAQHTILQAHISNDYKFTFPQNSGFVNNTENLADPVNTKLQFLYNKIQSFEVQNFRVIWTD